MRKNLTVITMGLAASCFFASGAGAEALLGHQYFEISGGWEHIENSASDDGLAAGVAWNMPIMVPQLTADFGMDLLVRGELADLSGRTMREAEGIVRGYMLQEGGFLPFGGVGVGVLDFDGLDSGYLPVEAGVELGIENIALRPYARYAFTFDDAIGDFWAIGAKGVLWFHPETWGLTGLLEYTNYQDGDASGFPESGLALRIGLIFDY